MNISIEQFVKVASSGVDPENFKEYVEAYHPQVYRDLLESMFSSPTEEVEWVEEAQDLIDRNKQGAAVRAICDTTGFSTSDAKSVVAGYIETGKWNLDSPII